MKTFTSYLFTKMGGGVELNSVNNAILSSFKTHALPFLLIIFMLSTFQNGLFSQSPYLENCSHIDTFTNVQGPFYFKLYMYSIADNEGLDGFSQQDMEKAYRYVTDAFDPHDIHFIWDCNVNYINNTTLYNTLPTSCNLAFGHSIADDGFHVFIFPDAPDPENLTFGGITRYGNVYSCAGGTWIHDGPASSIGLSFYLAHEIGHNLHLYHTHQSGENIDGSYCETTGDCVCDTPPEPFCSLQKHISMPGCNVINTFEGAECDYTGYTPDVHNIMSYSHPDCMRHFTKGQGQRMRNIIQRGIVDEWDLLDALISHIQPTLGQNTIWDLSSHSSGEVEIDGILYIDAGKTLTIASEITVYMGHMAQIIVKPGGRLNLYGTITSGSCSGIWKGIIVQGNSSKSQELDNNEIYQGRFFSYAGSKIENANTALQLWGPTLDSVGGIAYANGTEFLNNRITVELKPFLNYNPATTTKLEQLPYRTNFTKCQFLVDNNYPHFENFKKFVSLSGVRGVNFRGCTFDNQMNVVDPLDFDAYGYGIKADFSTFTVTQVCNGTVFPCPDWQKSTFKNLGYGIYASGGLRNPFGNVQIEHSTFENNYVSIFLSSTPAARILFNEFDMATLPDYEIGKYIIGVAIQGPTSFILEENEFNAEHFSEYITIGTAITHTGPFSNLIRKNTMDGLDYHNYSAKTNADNANAYSQGLHYLCNRNSNSEIYDHYVYEWGILRQLQGEVIDVNLMRASGNLLSKTGSSAGRDFGNYGSGEIDYHYFDQAANQTPEDYIGIQVYESQENTCPQQFFGPPTDLPIEQIRIDYGDGRPAFDNAVSQFLHYEHSNPSEAARYKLKATYFRNQMDTLAMAGLLYNLNDTLDYEQDSIYTWMERYHNPFGYLQLALWQFFDRDETAAYQLLDDIPQLLDISHEMQDDLDYMVALLSAIEGHEPGLYEDAELNILLSYVNDAPAAYMFLARDLLTQQGFHFPPVIYLDSHRPEQFTEETEEDVLNPEEMVLDKEIIVFPNPASRELNFYWNSNPFSEGRLRILLYNSLGVLITSEEIDAQVGKHSFNVRSYPSGLYFYRVGSIHGKSYHGNVQILH